MKNKIQQFFTNPYINGSFFLTVSNIIVSFLNYFYNVLSGRLLGPQGYGELGALLSYLTILSTPILIISAVVIQKIGKSGDQALSYTRVLEIWLIERLKRWLPYTVLIFVTVPLISSITHLSVYSSVALIILVILSLIGAFYNSALQGLRLFLATAVISIIATVLKLSGPVLVAVGLDGYMTVVAFAVLSGIFGLIITYYKVRTVVGNHVIIKSKQIQKRFVHLLFQPFILLTTFSLFSIILFNNFDIIFVKRFFDAKDAGIYVAWSLFAKMILYVLGPISSISYIFFSSVKERKRHSLILVLLITLIFCIGIVSFIVYRYFPHLVLGLLFGAKFNPVIPYLPIASLFGTSYAVLTILNNYFLAKNSKRALAVLIFFPLYVLALFIYHKSISEVMYAATAVTTLLICILILSQLVILSKSWIIRNNEPKHSEIT